MRKSCLLMIRPALCAALLVAPCAQAAGLATFNQATLARGFALPALGDAQALPDGETRLRASFDISSEYALERAGGEELLLDGETQRYALRYARGGSAGEWSIELPLLHVGGGFMDGPIRNWHDAFGLPDGGRDTAPDDRYRFRYLRDGVTQFDRRRGGTRLGDVLLSGGIEWRDGWMLRGQLKLPTGDEARLAGGNLGGAVWADAALPFGASTDWEGYASAGVSANQDADLLGDLQNRVIPFGGAGLAYRLLPSLQVLAQLYAHGPLYHDTGINALQRPGLPLTLGGRWCPGDGPCFELSFQEDLSVAASPDFSLRFAVLTR